MMKEAVILNVKRVLDFVDAPILERRTFIDNDGNRRRMKIRAAHILKPREAREIVIGAKAALLAELPEITEERRKFYGTATLVTEHLADIRDLLPMIYSDDEIATYLNKRKETLDRIESIQL